MTRFAYKKYKNENRQLFSNYTIRLPNAKLLDRQFFKDYSQSKFNVNNSVVCVDEAHIFVDSRNSMTKKNKVFSRFVTQSRKRDVDLLYTTQDMNVSTFMSSGQVELRLRKLTDRIIMCSVFKDENDKTICINQVYNNCGKLLKSYTFSGDSYFKLYDTYEIIDFNDSDD